MSVKIVIFITFIITQILDVYTTNRGLERGFKEKNPIVLYCMKKLDKYWPVIKIVYIGIFAIILFMGQSSVAIPVGLLILALYSYILYNNFTVLRR